MIQLSRTRLVRFDEFTYDFQAQSLSRSGSPVELQEQSRRFLDHLLCRAPDLVTRDELRHVLWPMDTVVDFERGITVTASKLRNTLGLSGRRLQTVVGRGYRWKAGEMSKGDGTPGDSATSYAHLEALWQRRRSQDLLRILRETRRLMEMGPENPRVHFLHAAALALAADYGLVSTDRGFPAAWQMVAGALGRWSESAEWWALRGFLEHRWWWRPQEAQRNFERAFDLQPDCTCALQWYGEFCSQTGRHDLAIRCASTAARGVPLASVADAVEAWVLLHAGDLGGARDCVEDARVLGRSTDLLYYVAARSEEDPTRAMRWLARVGRGNNNAPAHLLSEGVRRLMQLGRGTEAERWTERLGARPRDSYHHAKALAALRRGKAAMDRLDEAWRSRSPWVLDLAVDPDWNEWRDHPRFRDMAARSPF